MAEQFNDWIVNEKIEYFTVGEYVKITGQMILDKKIAAKDKVWLWIETESGRSHEESRLKFTGRRMGEYEASFGETFIKKMKNEPLFYMKVGKIGSKWIEGAPYFSNGAVRMGGCTNIRFLKKDVSSTPGSELKIFIKNQKLIVDTRNLHKFLMGDEQFVLDKQGEPVKEFTAGEYKTVGLNYDLTAKFKEVIFNILDSRKESESSDCFTIRLADYRKLKEKLPNEKLKVIASHMQKVIGAEVELEDNEFLMPWFNIQEQDSDDSKFDQPYSAKPFFTREQAERQIEFLKKSAETEKFPFNVNKLAIEECSGYERFSLSLSQLIEYIEAFGIKFNLPEFLEQKKGAIAAKKFGF